MKKVFMVFSIIMVLALAFTGCSGKKDTSGSSPVSDSNSEIQVTQASSGGTGIENLTVNNWQEVVKANFGIDYSTLPTGWTFKEVNSPNNTSNIKLFLTIGGNTTGEAEAQRLFDLTKSLSPHGNYQNRINWEADTVSEGDNINNLTEAVSFSGGGSIVASWSYTFNSMQIMLNYSVEGNQVAEYTFTRRGAVGKK